MNNQKIEIDHRQPKQKIINDDSNIDVYEQQYLSNNYVTTADRTHLNNDIHNIPLDDLFKYFNTDPQQGLSAALVANARTQYGDNRIISSKSPSFFSLLVKELFIGFNIILWIAGVFAFLAYKPFGEPNPSIANLALGIILALVIISNSLLNVYQEMKSTKIISSFSKLYTTTVTVRRDGRSQQILADEIVPGDILVIRAGDKIPADCRFLISDGLIINTLEVTGQSKPIIPTLHSTSDHMIKSTNIGFYSSLVEEGTGEAIVFATGNNTVLGKRTKNRQHNTSDGITGLHREINRFVLFVFIATIIFIGILWITWGAWLNRYHHVFLTYNGNIVNSIGMIVAFLPLGLPSTVTLVLTVVAKKMQRQHMLVKSLQIIETFNAVSVIITDKVGILTQNKMRVTHLLWDKQGIYEVPTTKPIIREGVLQRIGADIVNEIQSQTFRDLLRDAALCNNAEEQIIDDTSNRESGMHVVGDAADTALYNLCIDRCFFDITKVRQNNHRLKIAPFHSPKHCMITVHQLPSNHAFVKDENDQILIIMKGTTDPVLACCSSYMTDNNEILLLNDSIRQHLFNRQDELEKNGCRIIAMCQKIMAREEYDIMIERNVSSASNDYCFVGFFALVDPLRTEVPDAVLKAKGAQIRTVMITSDDPVAAEAIAKQIHIFTPEISITNGIHTFAKVQDIQAQTIFNLYENGQLLEQHLLPDVARLILQANNNPTTSSSMMETHLVDYETSWHKKVWASCRNQFTEPKSDLPQAVKLSYIPYAVVVDGTHIDFMDDFMWDWVLSHQELVFARTSAGQKQRIVEEFQRRGEIVAITGDGTNDVAALKCANLGIATQSGTEASKESSDVILLDDNFLWIVQAIETGRLLGDNLKKVAIYLLPGGSWSQIWPLFFSLWFGMPLALSAIWCTIFCMLNDVFMSLAMATEKPERDIMSRPPCNRDKDHLLNLKLLIHAYFFVGNLECFTAFFCFCYYWIDNGVPFYSFMFTYENFGIHPRTPYTTDELVLMNNIAQSVYYCSMCLFQFFNFFATRTRYTSILQHNPFYGKGQNLYVFGAMLISVGIQLLFSRIDWFNQTLDTGRVPVKYILPALVFGMLWLIIDELRKLLLRKYPRSFIARISW